METRLPALVSLLVACGGSPQNADGPAPAPQTDLATNVYGPLPEGTDLDTEFEAMFGPDDPVVTAEVALIDRVRDAFARDGGTYEEGANPYSIRYAVYNLRNPDIIEHLALAGEEGVDVQILIEQDQLDPARDWNTADETLVARGFELIPDHRYASEEELVTGDIVGIGGSGLMHLKTRLFATPEGTTLLTGSLNPGDEAAYNDETLHLVNDPAIVDRYARSYDAVLHRWGITNEWDDDAAVNVLFSPNADGPWAGARILEWLAEEDEQILLMVFSLRDISAPGVGDSLVDVVRDRVAAGVPVYVITDKKQSDGYYDRTEDYLRSAGATVWEVQNTCTEFTAMHHKVAVLGRTSIRVITDAANWTSAGLGSAGGSASNYESTLFVDTEALDDGRTGLRYLGQWMHVLAKYADTYGPPDGEPGFWEACDALVAQDGWPTQEVDFVATDAWTDWGEGVYVSGSVDALDNWGQDGPGHPLTTDDEGYPTWWSEQPAAIPVGLPFEWKLTAAFDGGEARWEDGANHQALAMPPALTGELGLELTEAWR